MTLLIITLTLLILGGIMIGVFVMCDSGSDAIEWLGMGGFVFVFFWNYHSSNIYNLCFCI